MDTRNLIAFGMLLAAVVAGLMKGAINGEHFKDVIQVLAGGVIGFTVPKGQQPAASGKPSSASPAQGAAMVALLAAAMLVFVGCYRGDPPWPGDPTAPPPSVSTCTEFRIDVNADAGTRDDAGTWHYPATAFAVPCNERRKR